MSEILCVSALQNYLCGNYLKKRRNLVFMFCHSKDLRIATQHGGRLYTNSLNMLGKMFNIFFIWNCQLLNLVQIFFYKLNFLQLNKDRRALELSSAILLSFSSLSLTWSQPIRTQYLFLVIKSTNQRQDSEKMSSYILWEDELEPAI